MPCRRPSLWTIAVWLVLGSKIESGETTECLVGCTIMGLDPYDSDRSVEWNDRGTCDDSAGCEVNTGDTLTTWVGCGASDASRCLWAATSGVDGSSDCTCSVCGGANSFASSYMEDYPTWTRIACYIADMEAVGYDASVCVAAVVDDGAMACVDEAYEIPTFEQYSCPWTGLSVRTTTNCLFDGTTREAEEMFERIGTPTPAPTIAATPAPASPPTLTPMVPPNANSNLPPVESAPSAEAGTPIGSTEAPSGTILPPEVTAVVASVIGGLVILCCFIGGLVTVLCGRNEHGVDVRGSGSSTVTAGSSGAAPEGTNTPDQRSSCACAPCLLAPWKVIVHSVSLVLAMFSPIDFVRDIAAIYGFLRNAQPALAALTLVIVFLSARFTVLFAALHPKPVFASMVFHYVFPSWAAYRDHRRNLRAPTLYVDAKEMSSRETTLGSRWAIKLKTILQARLRTASERGDDTIAVGDALAFEGIMIPFSFVAFPLICGASWSVIKHHATMARRAFNARLDRLEEQERGALAYVKSLKFIEALFEATPQLLVTIFLVGIPSDGVVDLDVYLYFSSLVLSTGAILWAAKEFLPSRKDIQNTMDMLNRGVSAIRRTPPPFFEFVPPTGPATR